jgi:hypothetical protein
MCDSVQHADSRLSQSVQKRQQIETTARIRARRDQLLLLLTRPSRDVALAWGSNKVGPSSLARPSWS